MWRFISKMTFAVLALGTHPVFGVSSIGPYYPVADAAVDQERPKSNFGSSHTLRVDMGPNQLSYIRFSVPAFSGTVGSAKLRLYVTNPSKDGASVLRTTSSWSENALTYANRPAATSGVLDDKGSVGEGWVEYNVTAAVKHGGLFTFIVRPTSTDGMDFYSREGKFRPELSITLTGSSPTPTPQPSATPSSTPTPTPQPSATPSPTPTSTPANDDTFSTLERSGPKVVLNQSYGFTEYKPSDLTANTTIDARLSTFIVANSKNPNPVASADCDSGSLQTNHYPIQLRNASGLGFVGALIEGRVPQQSDWLYTYCNSAAVGFWNANNPIVDGARVDGGWDSLRFSSASSGWTVKDSWLSNSHDDCIENDEGRTGLIKDSLFDGCYMGLSMAPGNSHAGDIVTLDGVLMRMKSFLTEGAVANGSPFKFDESANGIAVKNTIIAYDNSKLRSLSRTQRAWAKMKECSNNLILWMPDEAMPSDYPTPPACFTIIKGQAARDLWTRARQNWINCHSRVRHTAGDSAAVPQSCDANFWGGK